MLYMVDKSMLVHLIHPPTRQAPRSHVIDHHIAIIFSSFCCGIQL